MSFYPFNPNLGQVMQTNVPGVSVDRAFLAHFQVEGAKAVAASTTAVHAAIPCSADTTVKVEDGFTAPAVPRSITATAGGTTGSIKAVKVKVYGTNYLDEPISEELDAFTEDTAGTVESDKAFKTVTKVEIPAMDGAGVTVSIGFGNKLGLPFKLVHGIVLGTYLDNVLENNAPTLTLSGTAIEDNTINLNSALNGKVVDVYLIV